MGRKQKIQQMEQRWISKTNGGMNKCSSPRHASLSPVPSLDANSLSIYINDVGVAECFAPTDDFTMLQVIDVEGGPIRLWNKKVSTEAEKVRSGDLIVKVRKSGTKEWLSGDATKMRWALLSDGPFELQLRRGENDP